MRVSANGGSFPAWSGNGKELFFGSLTEDIFVCPVTPKGPEMEVGTPQRLLHATVPALGIPYDVSFDGKRLLLNHSEEGVQPPLQLVTNWPAGLKK